MTYNHCLDSFSRSYLTTIIFRLKDSVQMHHEHLDSSSFSSRIILVTVCLIQFYLMQKLSSKVLYPKRKKAKMWTRCWSPLHYNAPSKWNLKRLVWGCKVSHQSRGCGHENRGCAAGRREDNDEAWFRTVAMLLRSALFLEKRHKTKS